jgi:hypothetical protein
MIVTQFRIYQKIPTIPNIIFSFSHNSEWICFLNKKLPTVPLPRSYQFSWLGTRFYSQLGRQRAGNQKPIITFRHSELCVGTSTKFRNCGKISKYQDLELWDNFFSEFWDLPYKTTAVLWDGLLHQQARDGKKVCTHVIPKWTGHSILNLIRLTATALFYICKGPAKRKNLKRGQLQTVVKNYCEYIVIHGRRGGGVTPAPPEKNLPPCMHRVQNILSKSYKIKQETFPL